MTRKDMVGGLREGMSTARILLRIGLLGMGEVVCVFGISLAGSSLKETGKIAPVPVLLKKFAKEQAFERTGHFMLC